MKAHFHFLDCYDIIPQTEWLTHQKSNCLANFISSELWDLIFLNCKWILCVGYRLGLSGTVYVAWNDKACGLPILTAHVLEQEAGDTRSPSNQVPFCTFMFSLLFSLLGVSFGYPLLRRQYQFHWVRFQLMFSFELVTSLRALSSSTIGHTLRCWRWAPCGCEALSSNTVPLWDTGILSSLWFRCGFKILLFREVLLGGGGSCKW